MCKGGNTLCIVSVKFLLVSSPSLGVVTDKGARGSMGRMTMMAHVRTVSPIGILVQFMAMQVKQILAGAI